MMDQMLVIPRTPAAWLAGCYAAVAVAMAADFVAGIMKARRMGTPRTSRRFRRTAEKAGRYLLPMVCLSCVDVMVLAITEVPALTIAMGAFNVFCEFRSVMESTHDKEQIARVGDTLHSLVANRDNVLKLIAALIEAGASPASGGTSAPGASDYETSPAEDASSEAPSSPAASGH